MLKVENTAIKLLPSSFSLLTNLETVSLLGCECLIESPEFLHTSRLKMLIFAGCTSLVEVHKSIGLLKRLVFLDLGGCKKLMNLPSNISNLERLETLLLPDCFKEVYIIPERSRKMTELKILYQNRVAITQQQSSSSPLRNPTTFSLSRCRGASSSWISPKSSNYIIHIGVKKLSANGCTLLERVLTLGNESLGSFSLNICHKPVPCLKSTRWGYLLMGRCNNLSPAFRESVLQMIHKAANHYSLCLPGSEIPNWISQQTIGSLISFRVPSYWGPGKICKLLVWVVYATNEEAPRYFDRKDGFHWNFRYKTRRPTVSVEWGHTAKFFDSFEDHIVVEAIEFPGYLEDEKSGDEIEVRVRCLSPLGEENKCGIQVKKCGIHLVDEPNVIDEAYTSDVDISIDDEV